MNKFLTALVLGAFLIGAQQSHSQTILNFVKGGNPPYVPNTGDFDGSTYWKRGGDLTGAADSSQKGIISVWFRLDGGDGDARSLFSAPISRWAIFMLTANALEVKIWDIGTSQSVVEQIVLPTWAADGTTWRHALVSWDVSVPECHLYIDDVSPTMSVDKCVVDDLDGTWTDWGIAVRPDNNSQIFDGCMADLYVNQFEYLDFSVEANRRKFITSGLKPVSLGSDGSTPTGTAPIVFFDNAGASFGTNKGTGGNFTLSAGTMTNCSTAP